MELRKGRRLANLSLTGVAGVDKGANNAQMEGAVGFMVLKNDLAPPAPKESTVMPDLDPDAVVKAVTDSITATLNEKFKGLDDRLAEVEKAAKKPVPPFMKPEDDADAKTKAFDADVAKALEENPVLKAKFAEITATALAATETAKSAIDARLTDTFIAKASTEYGKLPIDPAKFGPILKSASEKLGADEFAEFERVLKSVAAIDGLATITKAYGVSGEGETPSAHEQLVAKALDIRKSNLNLTQEQAYVAATDLYPDLVAQYLKEA